ncbi:MAG: type II toxin-antitoxin system VapC family toxin [Actinomycetota bacterium]
MAEVLVDTDVLINHLAGRRRFDPGAETVWYSVVTRCELFAGRDANERVINRLLTPFTEIAVDRSIAERAGRLRRDLRIRTPDALIAASALAHRLELLTGNARDFAKVPGLTVRHAS